MTLVPVLRAQADVAIVGSGFGGSLLALALRRQGRSVVMIERGHHPRFAIGESSTPLANLLVEELADRWSLPRIRPLSKWGAWQRAYPQVAGGLKRGFSFFHHERGRAFIDGPDRAHQLLVAASPTDDVGDTHWYRPDVDQFLAGEAVAEGATLLDDTKLDAIRFRPDGADLEGTREGRSVHVAASFVVDASGPRGFLYRALALPERPLRWLPPTEALYTHFEGVKRWDELVASEEMPPYPVDDAALHHVFDGGWIWVLRFNNGVTSAGCALPRGISPNLAEGSAAWERVLASLPSVRAQFADARPILPFVHSPRLAVRMAVVSGPGWALLPSAVGVIDPLLSTGFPLTLLGVYRLAEALQSHWQRPTLDAALAAYAAETQAELDATERLVAALYATMSDFELFKRLGLLYFAAASYGETARRLGQPERAPGFLLCRHEAFGPESAACAEAALGRPKGAERQGLLDRIDRAIAPFDVAGLSDRSRRDWYPAKAEDLLAAAPRLGATENDIGRLLARCGFTREPAPSSGMSCRP